MTSDGSKAQGCKEHYCTGTWNVRSTNHGKLAVVKQETARLNIDSLGISELKWAGMGEFNSYDHYIYYCRQEPLRSQANSACKAPDDIMSPGTPLAAASHLTKLQSYREGLISCPKGRGALPPRGCPCGSSLVIEG